MVLGEVEAAFSLFDRAKSFFGKKASKDEVPTVADRFIELFEAHGVHRNQIPRFFGHGLEVADFTSVDSLLPKLSEEILNEACELFAIRREWLDCADNTIYGVQDFYKDPAGFDDFIKNISLNDDNGDVIEALVLFPVLPSQSKESAIVIGELIGTVGSNEIYRYYICNTYVSSYWKCRAYIASSIATIERYEYFARGGLVESQQLDGIVDGNIFLRDLSSKRWDASELILSPKAYLDGVDPEKDNFGVHSALVLWLDLAEKGYMDGYLPARVSEFKEALEIINKTV